MPKVKAVSVKKDNPPSADEPLLIPPSEIPAKDKETYWLNLVDDLPTFRAAISTISFWELMTDLPPALWESELVIYLYRLDPKMKNKDGDFKYIEVVNHPINEQWVKDTCGGGKYLAYLKYGKQQLKEIRFYIDGPPIFKEGQTIVGQVAPTAAPPATGRSELAEAIDATSKASNAGIEIMQKGMESAIALQTKLTEKSLGLTPAPTATPGPGDRLIEALLPRLLAPPDPLALLTQVMTIVKELTPKPVQNPEPPSQQELGGQLDLVKDIFGVESLRDLGSMLKGREPKVEATPWYAGMISTALERLPGILAQFSEMQQQAFQRAMIAHQMQNGQQVQPPALTRGQATPPAPGPRMARQVTTPAAATEQPPQNGSPKTLQEVIPLLIDSIARGFDNGFEGWQVATFVDVQFPGAMAELKPMLGDPAALTQFVSQVPVLAERSTKEDWPQFQADFLEYVKDNYSEEAATEISEVPKAVTAPGAA